jgi:hypothetical protein
MTDVFDLLTQKTRNAQPAYRMVAEDLNELSA